METSNIKNNTAKVASFILGEAHFMFKSLADITAHTEAVVVNKLTGKSIDAVKEDRHNETERHQEAIIKGAQMLRDKMVSLKAKAVTPEVFGTANMPSDIIDANLKVS